MRGCYRGARGDHRSAVPCVARGTGPGTSLAVPVERVPDRSAVTGPVSAICFPPDDPRFVGHVRDLIDAPGEPLLAAVQALLRETYPLAVLSPRHPVAALDGRRVWYAIRDGSVLADADGHSG